MTQWGKYRKADWERVLCELLLADYNFPNVLSLCSKGLYTCSITVIEKKLLPHQTRHYRKILERLKMYNRVVDTSVMGCGKTFTICAVAKKKNVDIIAFSPDSSQQNWLKAFQHFGIPREKWNWYGYNSFLCKEKPLMIATKHIPGKSSYLEYQTGQKVAKKFHKKCNNGVLLVFDEAHFLKNNSNRAKLAIMLIQTALEYSRSSIALLSSTPFDKPCHSGQFAKLLGIITSEHLTFYDRSTQTHNNDGMDEIIDYCKQLDREKTREIDTEQCKRSTANTIVHKYISQIIKPKLFVAMKPIVQDSEKDIVNMFGCLDDKENIQLVEAGLKLLEAGLNARKQSANSLAQLQKGMQNIEEGKIPLFLKLVYKSLSSNPKCKIIIMANYILSIDVIHKSLQQKGYDPLLVWGKTPKADRQGIIQKFQEPNTKFRILVCNTTILCQGQDLDDQHGEYPRHLFISPNYNITNLQQATGRVIRSKTMSKPKIRFVYVNGMQKEIEILTILAKKTKILQSLTEHQSQFPSDYPCIDENGQELYLLDTAVNEDEE